MQQPTAIEWTERSAPSIFICTVGYLFGIALYHATRGRTRDGEEHGSARWGSPKELCRQFAQKQNKLLTRHVRLGLDAKKHKRSLNVLVIGGSGAAKTRSYVLPNVLEANTNYVITDPKSEVLLATGGYLKGRGYDIRVLNLVNLSESDGYNPFRYLHDEKDALKLVNNLIQATTPKGNKSSDPFWEKSETALLQAIILMLVEDAPEEEQNFSMVMRTLEYAEVDEENSNSQSPLDMLFSELEQRHPNSVAVRQYKVFKQAAGKTAKSILVSTAVRLAPFNLPQLKAITDHDDMDLYTLGERKCALYAVIPDNDSTFVRPDRAFCIVEIVVLPRMMTREITHLTERRKLIREHSTMGTRQVTQRQSGATAPVDQVDIRVKLDLLNVIFQSLLCPGGGKCLKPPVYVHSLLES